MSLKQNIKNIREYNVNGEKLFIKSLHYTDVLIFRGHSYSVGLVNFSDDDLFYFPNDKAVYDFLEKRGCLKLLDFIEIDKASKNKVDFWFSGPKGALYPEEMNQSIVNRLLSNIVGNVVLNTEAYKNKETGKIEFKSSKGSITGLLDSNLIVKKDNENDDLNLYVIVNKDSIKIY